MNPGYQERVARHVAALTVGDPTDLAERRNRFGEESLEFQQSLGQTRAEAHALVDYVHGRSVGVPRAEAGGTAYTLAALANEAGLDLAACGEEELERLSTPEAMERIRLKRASRHGRGPLPGRDASSSAPAARFAEGAVAFAAGTPRSDGADDADWLSGWDAAEAHSGRPGRTGRAG